MTLRLHVAGPLAAGQSLALPADAARHVQVRRLQPGDALVLFDGQGGEWLATVQAMGRRDVDVDVGAHTQGIPEPAAALFLALGMPANERMDALVEKATELGAAGLQPLLTERSVLRLEGERAARRVAHWQAVAIGAAEQCGRTRVPWIAPVATLAGWLAAGAPLPIAPIAPISSIPPVSQGTAPQPLRLLLSTATAPGLVSRAGDPAVAAWLALSGPEGGLAPGEEAAARAAGFAPTSLGPRILRADTAPLAWLAQMDLLLHPPSTPG